MNKDMFIKSADSNEATSTEFEVLNIMIFVQSTRCILK